MRDRGPPHARGPHVSSRAVKRSSHAEQGRRGRCFISWIEELVLGGWLVCFGLERYIQKATPNTQEFKQNKSLSQQTGSTQVRTGAC